MIKLLVPKMPTADALLPYLRLIDEYRWYTNNGNLVQALEEQLSDRFGAHVVTVSSATAGLEIVWEALFQRHQYDGTPNKVLLPALTFPATALAARRAGWWVDFCDVDPDTWTAPGVSGFGAPSYGMVLDAAGAFGEQRAESMATVFSLHATKVLGAGEGGFIVTNDADAAVQYRRMANFGFDQGVSTGPGTNAKMSEYHAAVALASLDAYDRAPWLQLHDWYAEHLPPEVVQQKRHRGVYPMLAVKLPCAVPPVMERLKAVGIETRRWYYPCLAEHPLFALEGWREKLPVTADLSDHLLGLPYHLFLTESNVVFVCDQLRSAIVPHEQ